MKNKFINGIAKYKKDSLIKGFSVLLSGTVLTQIISLLLSPILTRLYTPEQYGINSIYISLLTIFGVFATLRFQSAIAISNSHYERKALSKVAAYSSIIISIFIFILLLLTRDWIFVKLNLPNDNWLLMLLPISILFLGIYEILFQNLLSHNKYKSMVKISMVKVATQGLSQIIFAFAQLDYLGLIIGNLISYIFPVIIMSSIMLKESKNKPKVTFNKDEYYSIVRKYIDFPRYALPSHLINIASYSLIPIVIAILFSAEVAGYYALANRLINIPISAFGNSLRQVYLREASTELSNTGNIKSAFFKTSKILLIVSLPCAIVLFVFGPVFFRIVFGEEWGISGVYVQTLILLFISRLIFAPLISTVNIIGKQRTGLIVSGGLLLSLLLISFIFGYFHLKEIYLFFILISVSYTLVYCLFYFSIYKLIKGEYIDYEVKKDNSTNDNSTNTSE